MDERVRLIVDFESASGVKGVNDLVNSLRSLQASGVQAGRGITAGLSGVTSGLTGIIGVAGGVAAAFGGIATAAAAAGAAIDFVGAGIKNADYLRDLQASLTALTGSVEAGEAAFERMEEAGQKVRVTGDELAKMFSQQLPLAINRGFSLEGAERFAIQIAKLAPAIGQSVEQAMEQASQILAGRVRGTNVLAAALGLDAKKFTAGLQSLDSVFPKLDELAAKGEKMGQTFETAAAKIKDNLLDAFSEGFNEARGATDSGIQGLIDAFNDPRLIGAIRKIGETVAEILPVVIETFAGAVEKISKFFDDVRGLIATFKGDMETIREVSQGDFLPTRQQEIAKQIQAIKDAQVQGPRLPAGLTIDPNRPLVDVEAINAATAAVGKFGTAMAGTGEKTKLVRDGMDKFTDKLGSAEEQVKNAQLAFTKLFTPPSDNPLEEKFQRLDEETAALVIRLESLSKSLDDLAKKPGIPSETAAGFRSLKATIDGLIESAPEMKDAMADAINAKAFEEQMAKVTESVQKTRASFNEFIEDAARGMDPAVAEGFRLAMEEMAASLNTMLDKLATPGEGLLGFFVPSPAVVAALKRHYENLGKDLMEAAKDAMASAQSSFDDLSSAIFANAGDNEGVIEKLREAGRQVAEQLQRDMPAAYQFSMEKAIAATQPALNKAYVEAVQRSAELLRNAIDKLGSNMAELFVSGVEGGAQGFAQSASRLFLQSVGEGAKGIFKSLASIAFGAAPKREDFAKTEAGYQEYLAAVEESNVQNANLVNAVSTVVGSVGQTLQIFENAKKGQETSVLATTLAFTAAGASIGGWIGALVGAIAGLTISLVANAKAKKEQPYAEYGIEEGVPYVRPYEPLADNFANVTAAMYNDMIAQMTETLEDTRNDYVKLMLKFGDDIGLATIEGITQSNFKPTMDQYKDVSRGFWHMFFRALFPFEGLASSYLTGGEGARAGGFGIDTRGEQFEEGQIGNPEYDAAARRSFLADFQNWVDNTLPREIIDSFKDPLAKGFEALGLQADRFGEIWDRLMLIDPKQAIESLNQLHDALVAFRDTTEYFGRSWREMMRTAFSTFGDTFADQLAKADVSIVALGQSLEFLIGPDQIAAANEFGQALKQREQAVRDFFVMLARAIDSVVNSYQAAIRNLELEGMVTEEGAPDIQAQVNYLKEYADSLLASIATASTPEEVLQLSQELQNTILKIKQLGGSVSPEMNEAYREWALRQLKIAQDAVTDRLHEFAQQVEAQNDAFLEAIQGFIDAFLGATEQLTGATDDRPDNETTEEEPREEHPRGYGRPPQGGRDPRGRGRGQGYGWDEYEPPPAFPPPPPPPATNVVYDPRLTGGIEPTTVVVRSGPPRPEYSERRASAPSNENVVAAIRDLHQLLVNTGGVPLEVRNRLELLVDSGETIVYQDTVETSGSRTVRSRGRR